MLGVPVQYKFQLAFFTVESQLKDSWNREFHKVRTLNPRDAG